MGLLDGVLGGLLNHGRSDGIISAMLGGATSAGDPTGANAPSAGLAGVLETLAANGLADHVASWLGGNQNIPITTDQLRTALGSDEVQQMAASLGVPVDDFLKHFVEHLPSAAAGSGGATSA